MPLGSGQVKPRYNIHAPPGRFDQGLLVHFSRHTLVPPRIKGETSGSKPTAGLLICVTSISRSDRPGGHRGPTKHIPRFNIVMGHPE